MKKAAIYFGKADTVTPNGFSYFGIDEILEDVLLTISHILLIRSWLIKHLKYTKQCWKYALPVYKYIKALGYSLSSIPLNYNIVDG